MIGLLAFALSTGCREAPQPQDAPQRAPTAAQPDLVLILIPGLRADAPGEPGAERALFDALGQSPARRFTAAYAQSAAAFVSAGSALTGLYPSALPMCGLYSDGQHTTDERDRAWCAEIPEARYTLPETLGIYGYRTALFTAGFHGARILAPKFQHWEDVSGLLPHRPTPWGELSKSLREWWTAADDAPRLAVLILPELQLSCRPGLARSMGIPATPALTLGADIDKARVMDAYSAAASSAGAGLAPLLASLLGDAEQPGARDIWIALSSTNGYTLTETTGMYDDQAHPFSTAQLLDRTARVPLALFGPAPPREPIDQPVELLDLFPTFAALAGATPPAGLTGEDLLALETANPAAFAYAEFGEFLLYRERSLLLSFRSFQHHPSALDPELTALLLQEPPLLRSFSLFNVEQDPYQTSPLDSQLPFALNRLRARMQNIRTGAAGVPDDALDPQKLWALRMAPSQGYW